MKTSLLLMTLVAGSLLRAQEPAQVVPAAILPFQERGAGLKGEGQKTSDLLFAKLAANPDLILLEREEMEKILREHELNLSGAVSPGNATQVGQLTGAKILITGSVIEADTTRILVAKIIGTETSRVLGESVEGKNTDELSPLVGQLAEKVGASVLKNADKLVAKRLTREERIAALKAKMPEGKRPTLAVKVAERHVGQATIDPAAETEFVLMAKAVGFEVLDGENATTKADVIVSGEGFSEFALRRGNLVSVKARVEIKAVARNGGKLAATDRQTCVTVDLTELIAGKSALQEAAAQIAERMLPVLAK
jgi:hypothetical protein